MTNAKPAQQQMGSRISRRTVAAGLAWTAPVVALAPAAFAYSTSAPNVTVVGGATKLPGSSCCSASNWPGPGPCPYFAQGYRYFFTASNPPGYDACLVVTAVRVGGTISATGTVTGGTSVSYLIWDSNNNVSTGCNCVTSPQTASRSIFLPAGCTIQFAIDADGSNSANTNMSFDYSIYNAGPVGALPTRTNSCITPTVTAAPSCAVDFMLTGQTTGTPVGGSCKPF